MYICKKCNSKYKSAGKNCPKCGDKLLVSQETLTEPAAFLGFLIDNNGVMLLSDRDAFCICVDVLDPQFAKEKRLLKLLATSGVLEDLYKVHLRSEAEKELAISKAINHLRHRHFLSRDVATEAVNWVTDSIGWNKIEPSFVAIEEPDITPQEAYELFSNEQYKKSINAVLYYAEQGIPELQAYAGYAYHHGLGVKEDVKKAYEWYLKAAEQGEAFAQYMVGGFLAVGRAVDENLTEARKWLKKSADQDNEEAKQLLRKIRLGFEEAFDLLKKKQYEESLPSLETYAEDLGDYRNGEMYYYCGLGFDQLKDYDSAFRNFSKAADKGNENGQAYVGLYYVLGNGVEQDQKKGRYYLNMAAGKGNKVAVDLIRLINGKD